MNVNSGSTLYQALPNYKDILNENVYNKYLFFLNKPTEIKGYCLLRKTPTNETVFPEAVSNQSHSFIYGSDQVPFYARYNQPCWGPFAGLPNNQTNLYIWTLWRNVDWSTYYQSYHPYWTFFKEVREGMFKSGTSDEEQQKFLKLFGVMYTPKVLDNWPAPVVVAFHCTKRYNSGTVHGGSAMNHLISKIMYQGSPYELYGAGLLGTANIINTWAQVRNLLHGEFNPSIMKLPAMSVDPDYQSWDSPLSNVFCDHDVTALGRYYTYRATDITWDDWVIRDNKNSEWYGRNNGSSKSPKTGEVFNDVKTFLLAKNPKTFDQAKELVSTLIREKVDKYNHGNASLLKAA